ncbi:MAG: hypothetical protein A2X01_14940 [Bacteroidetes bacterium GWF2_35_48]|nr:MAG: hypothetical protein A2X01_14940 [Bacteroidetes bacterium GWF2_35_48]
MNRISLLIIILSVVNISLISTTNIDKSYKHSFSGTYFPEKIDAFSIIEPKQYDNTGKDIGVGYRTSDEAELTQYIYPALENGQKTTLDAHFNNYKMALMTNYAEIKLIKEDKYVLNSKTGKYAQFTYIEEFHNKRQKLNSYLYIFEDKGWFIKIRVTCPINNKKSCDSAINEYLKKIPWPTMVRK